MKRFLFTCLLWVSASLAACGSGISPVHLRCEYLENPLGIDETSPRLSWQLVSEQRDQRQTAYQIRVASDVSRLAGDDVDLWDSGQVTSSQSLHIPYAGNPLASRQACVWSVRVWDRDGAASAWSPAASWSMGLLDPKDWTADYISFRDETPIATDTKSLYLPAARQYRKEFETQTAVRRATIYATALGIYELHLNGDRVGDAYFAPGWTDYRQRAYYNTYDVTSLVQSGTNALGVWAADGWYSGYVGFGLLTGMGTEKTGRSIYGKTPAVMAQLEIEYTDGSRETIPTDSTWKVTGEGPIQEADLLMGELYDARREQSGWSTAGFDDADWQAAILARENAPAVATFYENHNPADQRNAPASKGPRIEGRERDLSFHRPRLEAFPGVPVRLIEEIPAVTVTQRGPGNFIFDLGQNFAGVVRMKVKGPAGHRIQLRFGEMLHPDGRLMTENLRKARAQDFYICRGNPEGEIYQPRFTFHGFQFVELVNFPGPASLDSITGLVMHSDTPLTSDFACSDPMVNQLFSNVVWTQRANFLDLPTDCPQRDERMGWTGDAQAYVGTAAFNADIGAFYTKWLRELMESQRPSGVFPGYAPFPFQHGWDFGSAWADAGVICPWTMWQAYGDTRVIEACWQPMTRFMQWRKSTSVNHLGIAHGNPWGDWLAQGADTPLDFVDTVYFAISAKMMAEMAAATGRDEEAATYRNQFQQTKAAFAKQYLTADGRVKVETQTAHALALFADLVPAHQRLATGAHLAAMIAENGNRMSTGFLGTRPLLPVLSSVGQHDLATFLLQSREFPSWGYEIANGATTIWERWDSYTKEDAFGRHNAAMNSFSHYAFGAVCEWMFQTLAGIDSDGPGYDRIIIRPQSPSPASNAMHEPIDWVQATYHSIRGMIRSDWKREQDQFFLTVTIPTNTTAMVDLPCDDVASITESGQPIDQVEGVQLVRHAAGLATLRVGSGDYQFVANATFPVAKTSLKTSPPVDKSINPDEIDLASAKELVRWNFNQPEDLAQWVRRQDVKVERRNGKTFLIAAGADSQLATTFDPAYAGRLVIELKAMPSKAVTTQFYWASPQGGFSEPESAQRLLAATEQVNAYLFPVQTTTAIKQLRFDPFAMYDEYANQSEMYVESIAIHQLPIADSPQQRADHARRPAGPAQPNVLFILSEDQGSHLSLLGTAGLQTPHIDSLALSGTYFDHAFVAYPVCSASKAAFYTGLHNHTNGILNNTHNFHKPASEVTPQARGLRLAQINRIHDRYATLTEILQARGYYQGVTHKLHVLPNEKFPYDEFLGGKTPDVPGFLHRAQQTGQPWFLLVNIPDSHRPYPNSDRQPIRVDPAMVELPSYLPDTPVVRQDWAEYLAGIEAVDAKVGETLAALDAAGQADQTIVIYLSDHGPTFQRGKMTLYDLGLRVPLIFSGPGIKAGVRSEALASELDLLPTLLDLIATPQDSDPYMRHLPYPLHGKSLKDVLTGQTSGGGHEYIVAQISNLGPLPNEGIQERSIQDRRWKLIYRENVEQKWRQVNDDSRMFKTWGNRTYAETIRVKKRFPDAFRVLAEMDPQELGGDVPSLELYDLNNDPDEMQNLADEPAQQAERQRLLDALRRWAVWTQDPATRLSSDL